MQGGIELRCAQGVQAQELAAQESQDSDLILAEGEIVIAVQKALLQLLAGPFPRVHAGDGDLGDAVWPEKDGLVGRVVALHPQEGFAVHQQDRFRAPVPG